MTQNYHGFAPLWVPRASYKFYKRTLDTAMKDLAAFEKAYIEYNDALSKKQDLNAKLKLAYENTSSMAASLKDDISDLKTRLLSLGIKIKAQKYVVEVAHDQLMKAYKAEEKTIKAAFGVTVPQM